MKRKMRLVIGNCIAAILAAGAFIGIFCLLTPWIVSLVPAGPWKHFDDAVVFIIVGVCGGVGLPAIIGVVGVLSASVWADGASNVGD